jgi:hypothetical protein
MPEEDHLYCSKQNGQAMACPNNRNTLFLPEQADKPIHALIPCHQRWYQEATVPTVLSKCCFIVEILLTYDYRKMDTIKLECDNWRYTVYTSSSDKGTVCDQSIGTSSLGQQKKNAKVYAMPTPTASVFA